MIRCSFPARRLATAAGLILILWLVACSSTGPGARTDDSEAARRLYNHLEQEYLLHRDAEVLQLGATFQADYPGHDLADAVSARMIASAVRLPDLDLALDLARQVLKPGGGFLVKLFQGDGFEAYNKELKASFSRVVMRKPKASRARSREAYALATGFRG